MDFYWILIIGIISSVIVTIECAPQITGVALYNTEVPPATKIRNFNLNVASTAGSNTVNYQEYGFFNVYVEVNSDTRCIRFFNTGNPTDIRQDTNSPFTIVSTAGDWNADIRIHNLTIISYGTSSCGSQGQSVFLLLNVVSAPFTTSVTTSPLTTRPLTTSPLTTNPLTTQAVTSNRLTTSFLTTNRLTTANPTTSRLTTSNPTTSRLTTNNPTTASPLTTSVLTTDSITSNQIPEITSSEITTSEIELPSSSLTTSMSDIQTSSSLTDELTSGDGEAQGSDDITSENIAVSTTEGFTTGNEPEKKESKGIQNNKGALIGIIVGGAVFLILVIIIVVVLVKKKTPKPKQDPKSSIVEMFAWKGQDKDDFF